MNTENPYAHEDNFQLWHQLCLLEVTKSMKEENYRTVQSIVLHV
ncbi:hypothetical protein [Cellvibrio mixtus]|nr:hypothetical protein [Cellvibrio mixtus]